MVSAGGGPGPTGQTVYPLLHRGVEALDGDAGAASSTPDRTALPVLQQALSPSQQDPQTAGKHTHN